MNLYESFSKNLKESEDFEEIIDTIGSAEEYYEIYNALSDILDDDIRVDAEQVVEQCEEDGDDVETAASIVCSDILDMWTFEENTPTTKKDWLARRNKKESDEGSNKWLAPKDEEWISKQGHKEALDKILAEYKSTGDVDDDERNLETKASNYFYDEVGIYNENIDSLCSKWAHDRAVELNNKSINEAEDYDPDTAVTSPIELNTGVLPIVDVDQYSRQEYIYSQEELMNDVEGDGSKILEPGDEGYFEITTDMLDEATMKIAPHVIENYIDIVLPGSKVEATKMYHPKQYNYGGDELEFKVSFVPANYQQLEKEVTSNPEFKNFLKENYSSYSGFISSMADNLDEFYQQDGWKQFVQVVMFALKDHESDMKDSEESMWEAIMQEVL